MCVHASYFFGYWNFKSFHALRLRPERAWFLWALFTLWPCLYPDGILFFDGAGPWSDYEAAAWPWHTLPDLGIIPTCIRCSSVPYTPLRRECLPCKQTRRANKAYGSQGAHFLPQNNEPEVTNRQARRIPQRRRLTAAHTPSRACVLDEESRTSWTIVNRHCWKKILL